MDTLPPDGCFLHPYIQNSTLSFKPLDPGLQVLQSTLLLRRVPENEGKNNQ